MGRSRQKEKEEVSPENLYKTRIRKLLNRLLNDTENENIDFESVAFCELEAEFAKKDEETTDLLMEILFETLKRSGCIDRLLLLQLFDRFFSRFIQFRDTILNDPQEFLELTMETNPIKNPLPGAKPIGQKLKMETIKVVKKWEEKYFKVDARMKCMVVTLKKTKFVDYDKMNEDFEAERIRKEKIQQRKKLLIDNTLSAYRTKFEKIKNVTDKLAMEVETALKILVPSFTDDPNIPSTSKATTSSSAISSESFEIHIKSLAPEVVVSSENDALVEAFIDAKLLLIHRVQTLRKLVKRVQILREYGEELAETIIVYRESLKKIVLKGEDLKIKGNPKKSKEEKKKKRFDDDFIDVEMSVDDILMIQYSQKAEEEKKKEEEEQKRKEEKEGGNPDKIDKKKEPVVKCVPYGLDLKYWGEERGTVQFPKNNADCHRFWRSGDEETSYGTAHQQIYTQRQFTFVSEAPKSDKVCRAKLLNGSLCPRRDFHKCPLHGPIVDRDDKGDPITANDRRADIEREERKRKKESDEFAKEIEKQYGKKKKRKHDVETTHSEDVRSRLQKKLLDPKTVARVSAVMDASRKNRLQKNFGQQFSHM